MISSATQYHLLTSYDRHKMGGHALDWGNQPRAYKEYPGVEPIPLPKEVPLPREPLSRLLKKSRTRAPFQQIDLNALSSTLLLTCTLTARARHPDGDFYYRSAASAGALYPTEIYVATKSVEGLDDGLYHFAIQHQGLVLLRKQDLSHAIQGITRSAEDASPALTFFLSAVFFRSAWKYRDRSYRYHLLDTGHVAENLILALKAQNLPFRLFYDFDDEKANELLGLDELREATLALVPVYGKVHESSREGQAVEPLAERFLKASIVSEREVEYPTVREVHALGKATAVGPDPETDMVPELGISPRSWAGMDASIGWPEVLEYPEVLFRRRSRRNFIRQPLSKEQAMALSETLFSGDPPQTAQERGYDRSVCLGILVGRVGAVEPGFYLLDAKKKSIGLIRAGGFMAGMARACLDQAWLANAGAHFLFLADLHQLDRAWGARGYRYAMMTAGRMGEMLYIAAESMGLGCCGIGAFYDDEAAALLGLNENSRLLYLVGVGKIKGGVGD